MSGIVSLASLSSPQTIWAIINQFQLLLLLPLTGAFVPQEVVEYLKGMKFVILNFNFVPLSDLSLLSKLYSYFSLPQKVEYLQEIDIESGSTLLNCFPLTLLFAFYLTCHALVLILRR